MLKSLPTWSLLASMVFVVSGQPAAAKANEAAPALRYSLPMLPLLYGYAGCLYSDGEQTSELSIQACATARKTLTDEASKILPEWHRGVPEDSLQVLAMAFDKLEDELRFANKYREPLPEEIIEYLDCTARYLLADEGYREGLYMEGFRADAECRDAVKNAWTGKTRKLSRTLYRQIALGGTFRRPVRGQGPWLSRTISFETNRNGLFNPPSER